MEEQFDSSNSASKIEWHKVTWYSQILAIVIGVAIFGGGFLLGRYYEQTTKTSFLTTLEDSEQVQINNKDSLGTTTAQVSSAEDTCVDGRYDQSFVPGERFVDEATQTSFIVPSSAESVTVLISRCRVYPYHSLAVYIDFNLDGSDESKTLWLNSKWEVSSVSWTAGSPVIDTGSDTVVINGEERTFSIYEAVKWTEEDGFSWEEGDGNPFTVTYLPFKKTEVYEKGEREISVTREYYISAPYKTDEEKQVVHNFVSSLKLLD